MKRYNKKILLVPENGITFKVSKGENGELIIRAQKTVSNNVSNNDSNSVSAGEYANVLSVYTDKDGNQAVIPQGWTVSGVPNENIIWGKDKSLVIYHIPKEKVSGINWQNPDEIETLMKTYDQFVWIPVSLLTANGTLDGIHYTEKFGKRNYQNRSVPCEPLVDEFLSQKESVDKYGGFYTSRYDISKDEKTEKPRSIKGVEPWTGCYITDAIIEAGLMFVEETFSSHLMYGDEYDTRSQWAIETGTVTIEEISMDSTELGNYYNNSNYPCKMVKTGEDGSINNIFGFAGNVSEWIQEKNDYNNLVTCGGDWLSDEDDVWPVDFRGYVNPYGNNNYRRISFRVTLCLD
jgi:hypothetical protein